MLRSEAEAGEFLGHLVGLAGGRVKITFEGHNTVWQGRFNGVGREYDAAILHYEKMLTRKDPSDPGNVPGLGPEGEVMHLDDVVLVEPLGEIGEPISFRWSRFRDRLYTISKE